MSPIDVQLVVHHSSSSAITVVALLMQGDKAMLAVEATGQHILSVG